MFFLQYGNAVYGCKNYLKDAAATERVETARKFYLERSRSNPGFEKFVSRHFRADANLLPIFSELLTKLEASELAQNEGGFKFEIPGLLFANGNVFVSDSRVVVSVQRLLYFDSKAGDYYRVGQPLEGRRGLELARGRALRTATLAFLVYGAERAARESAVSEVKFVAREVRIASLEVILKERFGFYKYEPKTGPAKFPDYLLKVKWGQ